MNKTHSVVNLKWLFCCTVYVECLVSTNTFVCRHPKVGLERQQSHEVTIKI